MTPVATQRYSAHTSTATARYETLRRAVLGEALPPEARSGLALFLRRGMWGWARAVAAAHTPQQTVAAPAPGLTAPCAQSPIVHIFAAMAMSANDRRAP
jgi:hypothetical protein